MVMRSDVETSTQTRFHGYTTLVVAGALFASHFVSGCIPKRSCEFTRTCPAESVDASTPDVPAASSSHQASSAASLSDASAAPNDAAAPLDAAPDADVAPVPIIACDRSTDCTPELPFCEDTAKVCTACRADRDCKSDDAPLCLLDAAEPQNNHCVRCLTNDDCNAGVCLDNSCVACNTDTNEGCEGSTPICAAVGGTPTCVTCEVDVDCSATPETPTCSGHICKACSESDPSHCPTEAPVCVEEATSARCVTCTESAHCQLTEDGGSEGTAMCVQEHCTACVLGTGEGCPSHHPFCAALVPEPGDAGVSFLAPTLSATPTADQYLEYEHACIECLDSSQDGGCGGSLPGCFEGNCVQCTEDVHCQEASASICDTTTHTCVGCQAVGDCSHQSERKTVACDIENRMCVRCTAAEDTCGEKACQTVPGEGQYTCSTVNKGQTSPCFECVGDSACMAGSNCIHDIYEGTDGGWRCLKREPALGNGDTCADLKVFDTPMATTSIDGVAGPYCHPRLTSCQGYRHYGEGPVAGDNGQDTCLTHDDCGLPGIADGFCAPISANANRCTYPCVSAQDCDSPLQCATITGVDATDAKVCAL